MPIVQTPETNGPLLNKPTPPGKVGFVRHARDAQRVVKLESIIPITPPPPLTEESFPPPPTKVGIVHEYGLPGRPRKDEKHLRLPPGLLTLRRGRSTYHPEYAEEYIEAYYASGGSITRACRKTGVKFASIREWMDEYPEFKRALDEIDLILKDEVHSQFMTRVLNEWEPNPAWKFKYFNKHFPEYSEMKKQLKVSFNLKDTLIRPDVVEGVVVRKEIGPGDAIRSEQPMDAITNSS